MNKWYASKKVIFLVITFFLFAVMGGYFGIKEIFFSDPKLSLDSKDMAEDSLVSRINILLLATDELKPGEKNRTDTIMFVSLEPKTKSIAILSIPRDTRVKLPQGNYDKINAAYVYGGVDLTKKVVEDLLGVPIHYHFLLNFDGFKDMIDTIGGVTVQVDKRMNNGVLRLDKGTHKLDGKTALEYVRFRSDALGDIGRTQRQQQFIKILADEMLQFKNIPKIPKLLSLLFKASDTDLSLTEMTKLANFARKVEREKIITQTLPGNFYNFKGISYWAVNNEGVKEFVQKLLATGETDDFIDNSAQSGSENDANVVKEEPKVPSTEKKIKPLPPSVINPKTNPPKTTNPNTGTPGSKAPGSGTPGTGIPDTETPGTETPGTGTPGTETPGSVTPDTGTPGTETPGTETPDTGTPGTETPDTETPGTGTPGTETPSTGTTNTGV